MSTIAKKVKDLKPPKFKVRLRKPRRLCGRPRGYLRKFALCRLCFRQRALDGEGRRRHEEQLVAGITVDGGVPATVTGGRGTGENGELCQTRSLTC